MATHVSKSLGAFLGEGVKAPFGALPHLVATNPHSRRGAFGSAPEPRDGAHYAQPAEFWRAFARIGLGIRLPAGAVVDARKEGELDGHFPVRKDLGG